MPPTSPPRAALVLVDGYDSIAAPAFEYSDFRVAPYDASAYPTLDAYADPFYYDPGGRVAGFHYSERVAPDTPRVRFRADLVSAADGDVLGEVPIPFTVNQE